MNPRSWAAMEPSTESEELDLEQLHIFLEVKHHQLAV